MKKCTKCKKMKHNKDFYKNRSIKGDLSYYCNNCDKLIKNKYRKTIDGVITRIYYQQKQSCKKRNYSLPTYSKSEFKKWVLEQQNFKELYKNWVASGYLTNLKPSVDRKDDYKSYTFKNIQLITWGENNRKSHRDKINGINTKDSISIKMYNYTSKIFLHEFYSINEAERQTGIYQSNISKLILKTGNYATVKCNKYKGIKVYFNKIV